MLSKMLKFKPLSLYFAYLFICSAATIALTLSAPSDLENQWLWGYSLNRWLMVFAMIVVGLLAGAALYGISRGGRFSLRLEKLFRFSPAFSTLLFVLLLALGFLLLLTFTPLLPNRFFFARLRPLLILALLVGLGSTGYDLCVLRHRPWIVLIDLARSGFKWCQQAAAGALRLFYLAMSGYRFLILPLALALPLLFGVALKYENPTGYAGLYTLMSDELVSAGFRLPQTVSYYGPGGMPFAYPPVGFYLMGLITSLFHISDFSYLRFAPPLFSWLALIPLALLTFELTHSRGAAVIAALIVAASQRIFYIHGTSGGMVRALAFLFALWGMYFYLRSAQFSRRRSALFAGIMFALTVLTHLGYAEFAFLFVVAYTLTHLNHKSTYSTALITSLVVLALVAPWVTVMVQQHGWQIFSGAFQSHGNNYFLSVFQDPTRLLPWFESSLHAIYKLQFVWGLILLALIFAVLNRASLLPVWFGLILLLISEGDRYLITSGAVLIGMLASALAERIKYFAPPGVLYWRSLIFLAVVTGLFYQLGWRTIPVENPSYIKAETLDLADYVKTQTDPDDVFLIVAEAEEAEWFPYLLQRTPAAASWGAEWSGNYAQQLEQVSKIAECQKTDSFACLTESLQGLSAPPDLLITHLNTPIINQNLSDAPAWSVVYQNERYILWRHAD